MSRFYQPWHYHDESLAGDRRSGPRHEKRDSTQPVENHEDPERVMAKDKGVVHLPELVTGVVEAGENLGMDELAPRTSNLWICHVYPTCLTSYSAC
ncbi:hypothetical protein T4A_11428 [Trichinella pseudospiralis]|uniref:Uncharacterized protein n=2 Tax=Trichinella pseudospiralis TaxID=6337 RepID=A0A0V1F0L7_TRIPS|nr:hypothetical protein T4A_11428 [Trichinella pseudospiralis]